MDMKRTLQGSTVTGLGPSSPLPHMSCQGGTPAAIGEASVWDRPCCSETLEHLAPRHAVSTLGWASHRNEGDAGLLYRKKEKVKLCWCGGPFEPCRDWVVVPGAEHDTFGPEAAFLFFPVSGITPALMDNNEQWTKEKNTKQAKNVA